MNVSVDDFKKLRLKVGKIISAEPVKGSKKLLKLKVDVGEKEPRQIVAGLSEAYRAEELVNKHVVLLTNLKPAKIFGIESNGMLLAAVSENKVSLLTVDKDVPVGSKVE